MQNVPATGPGYSRLLGADFAAPGAAGAVGTAVPAHQVVAAPASVGLGADAAQAVLAAGAGPLAVALAAPLGSLAPDLQQLVLQAPARRHQELSEAPRDPGNTRHPHSLIHSGEAAPAQLQPPSHLILLSSALRSSSSRCRTCRIRSLSTSDRKDRSTASDIAAPGWLALTGRQLGTCQLLSAGRAPRGAPFPLPGLDPGLAARRTPARPPPPPPCPGLGSGRLPAPPRR